MPPTVKLYPPLLALSILLIFAANDADAHDRRQRDTKQQRSTKRVTNYAGPGPFTFKTHPSINEACRLHDLAYSRARGGVRNYIFGYAVESIQRADRLLADRMRYLRKRGLIPRSAHRHARLIEYVFRVKGRMDRRGSRRRRARTRNRRHDYRDRCHRGC